MLTHMSTTMPLYYSNMTWYYYLFYSILCHAMLCIPYIMLFYAMLCCAMLRHCMLVSDAKRAFRGARSGSCCEGPAPAHEYTYLTQSVVQVVLQMSIPAQIRQPVPYISSSKG